MRTEHDHTGITTRRALFASVFFTCSIALMAQGNCTNANQYPSGTIQVDNSGAVQFLNSCVYFGEYSVLSGFVANNVYEFTIDGNGYITLRTGSPTGPVLAQGNSPLQASVPGSGSVFVHYNGDASCSIGENCQVTTVARILNCDMPVVSFAPWIDCTTGEFHVTVNVTDIGDASGVTIGVLGQQPAYVSVGTGSYELGPFLTLQGVGIFVANVDDQDCIVGSPLPLLEPECPVDVVCGEPELTFTYCYQANENRTWTYFADGGGTLRLHFVRGSIELSSSDQLRIYDGPDASGTLLFEHVLDAFANLGPEGSAVNNIGEDHYSADVLATSGSIHMVLVSDQFIECATHSFFDPWEWVVTCLDCTPPQGSANINVDCASLGFHVQVEVTSTGDVPAVQVAYTVDGGPAQVQGGLGTGLHTIGPFDLESVVDLRLEHPVEPACMQHLGTFTGGFCPVPVLCGAPPTAASYCYTNNEHKEWLYTATGQGVLRLRFLRGTVEDAIWDRLSIYDGSDTTGALLFQNQGSITNLGPAGSAIAGISHGYQTVDVYATSGSLYMLLLSDISINCANPDFDPWEWEVTCMDPALTGRAFLDYDQDCTLGNDDLLMPQMVMMVLPGPLFTTTNQDGTYYLDLPDGDYTIQQVNTYVTDHCNAAPQPFTIAQGAQVVIDLADTASTALDLAVMMTSGPARVGFPYAQAVAVQNLSAVTSDAITLVLLMDDALTFNYAVPAPTSVDGTTITWELPSLGAFQQQAVQVHYQVPPLISLLGVETSTQVSVSSAAPDEDEANNAVVHLRTITAAYDPNDKLASTSTGGTEVFLMDADEWIDYTIRFQNTGNDTAFTVVITDTLPPQLDPASIQVGAASHPFTWALSGHGTLTFTFANILLPDSNVNEPLSHGFVGFRIRPRLPLLSGEEIINIANIYFDFNPPVITEPSVLVATMGTGGPIIADGHATARLVPNPALGVVEVHGMDGDLQQARILGTDGRTVRSYGPTAALHRFDLHGITAGAYLIELVTTSGATLRLPLIIARP